MIKKIASIVVCLPIIIGLILLIIANSSLVKLNFNIFKYEGNRFSFTAPFFVWIILFLIIGIFVEKILSWVSRKKKYCKKSN